MQPSDVHSLCLDWLLQNKHNVKPLVQKYIDSRNEHLAHHDIAFVDDINKEFTSLTKSIILVELARHLPCNAEELVMFTEGFNINNYLDIL